MKRRNLARLLSGSVLTIAGMIGISVLNVATWAVFWAFLLGSGSAHMVDYLRGEPK